MSHNSSELIAIKVIRQLTSYFVEKPVHCQWNKEKQVDKVKSFNKIGMLFSYFMQCECVIDSNDALSVIQAAEKFLASEENLLYIPVPVMVTICVVHFMECNLLGLLFILMIYQSMTVLVIDSYIIL